MLEHHKCTHVGHINHKTHPQCTVNGPGKQVMILNRGCISDIKVQLRVWLTIFSSKQTKHKSTKDIVRKQVYNNQRREGMGQPDISCKEIKNNIPDFGLTSAHKKGGSGDEEAVWVTWKEKK